jgi:putative transposase
VRPVPHTLGPTLEARAEAYRHLLHETLSADELTAIRTYLQQQRAWGRDNFRAMVDAKTRRFATMPPRPIPWRLCCAPIHGQPRR